MPPPGIHLSFFSPSKGILSEAFAHLTLIIGIPLFRLQGKAGRNDLDFRSCSYELRASDAPARDFC